MTSIGGSSDLPEWGGGCKRDVVFKYLFLRVLLLLYMYRYTFQFLFHQLFKTFWNLSRVYIQQTLYNEYNFFRIECVSAPGPLSPRSAKFFFQISIFDILILQNIKIFQVILIITLSFSQLQYTNLWPFDSTSISHQRAWPSHVWGTALGA